MEVKKLLERLRHLLGSGASNDEVEDYFLERVAREVMKLSEAAFDPTLARAVVRTFCLEECLAEVRMFRCRDTDFLYGYAVLDKGYAVFFYFADAGLGFSMLNHSEGQRTIRFGIGAIPTPPSAPRAPTSGPLLN